MPCEDSEVIDRLMPKFLYFKYALWAGLWLWLCLNFYPANMPYGQTYAQIFILQICLMSRLMAIPNFLYCKYAIWADLCPNCYTSNMPLGQTGRLMAIPKFLYCKYAIWADLCPNFYT